MGFLNAVPEPQMKLDMTNENCLPFFPAAYKASQENRLMLVQFGNPRFGETLQMLKMHAAFRSTRYTHQSVLVLLVMHCHVW